MAERRMFAKTIVLSDAFLDMPLSARCLYFTLGMLADDDGFVNAPRSVMRQCGASDDDMKLLIAKKFVLLFDSGVIVIKHWRINNYLRGDRYTETKYVEEKSELTVDAKGGYTTNKEALPIPDNSEIPPEDDEKPETWSERRKRVYAESSLPYSFIYKIRHAFSDKPCPICGYAMRNIENGVHRPTVQHNKPISKGGKHELDNISVICHQCNVTLRDKETGPLNNEEVKQEWAKISVGGDGIPSMGTPSIGKDSIDKVSIDKDSIAADYNTAAAAKKKIEIPSLIEIERFAQSERIPLPEAAGFKSYWDSRNWKTASGEDVSNWKAMFRYQHEHGIPKGTKITTASEYAAMIDAAPIPTEEQLKMLEAMI